MAGGRLRAALLAAGAVLLAALLVAAIGAPLGLFAGKRPADLGLHDGRLRGGDWRPNWVCSQASAGDATHHVEALAFTGEPGAAWDALEGAVRAIPRSNIVSRDARYMHVEFSSRALGFVDDAEFVLDAPARLIHLCSRARLGVRDFGVNRQRVESLRAALAARTKRGGPPAT